MVRLSCSGVLLCLVGCGTRPAAAEAPVRNRGATFAPAACTTVDDEVRLWAQRLGDSARASQRIEAAQMLARLGPLALGAEPELILALIDGDSEVEVNAMGALARLAYATPEIVVALQAKLQSDVGFVRDAAAAALRVLGVEPGVPDVHEVGGSDAFVARQGVDGTLP